VEQVPVVTNEIVNAETVQTPVVVEVNVTGRLELAVGATTKVFPERS
jgi:hypothetical protein